MSNLQQYDLIIKNGKIIDGTGNPSYIGEVGVKDDKIVTITEKFDDTVTAKKVIDANGQYITPGFVDIHTHIDGETVLKNKCILFDRYVENFTRQGITTVVGGMCGMGELFTGAYLEKVDEGKTGPNVALLLGHASIRITAMGGIEDREPTIEEMNTMKTMVRNSLEEGGFGLSTGLGYTPGSYAKPEEIIELCKIVAEYDGMYSTHIRNQSRDIKKSWEEAIEVGRQSGVHVHIAHTQIIGEECWGVAGDLIEMLNDARKEGINVTCDAFPYEGAGVTITGAVIPPWAQAGAKSNQAGINDALQRRLREPETLEKMKPEMLDLLGLRGGAEGMLLASCMSDPSRSKEIKGKYLSDICKEKNLDPLDAIVELLKEYGDVLTTCFQASFEDKVNFYRSEYCSVATDATCELDQRLLGIECQPREYGTCPKFIKDYVKTHNIFTIEEAIRKMTSLPAETLGLKDRGILREGMKADIVVFNYDTIQDNATFEDTHQYPTGINVVVINGKVVVLDEKHQRILSGVSIYRGQN